MVAQDSAILLHEGLPDKLLIDEWSLDGDWILILNDLMYDAAESKVINYLFTVGSHHKRATVLIMSHNLYMQEKQSRTISLNCHYFVLFQNRRDVNQVQKFARQAYPRRVSYFLSAYDIAMTGGNHSYLLVDLFPKSTAAENHRLRSHIFPVKIWSYIYRRYNSERAKKGRKERTNGRMNEQMRTRCER
jgi:hypothetical protein